MTLGMRNDPPRHRMKIREVSMDGEIERTVTLAGSKSVSNSSGMPGRAPQVQVEEYLLKLP